MLPVGPGAEKEYSNDWWAFTCCHGTGMENHVKYPDAQLFRAAGTLYLNQYLPAVIEEEDLRLDVNVSFPEGRGTVTVTASEPLTLKLRIPPWCRENPFRPEGLTADGLTAAGLTVTGLTVTGRYASLALEAGKTVEISVYFRYHPRFEYTPDLTQDGHRLAALLYGPFVMVTEDPSKEYLTLDADSRPEPLPDRFALSFSGRTFIPMYEAHGIPYHTYFKLK